ncbi:MAG: RNA methyltransferase [Candidatus Onthovivens sp.]|nr:RNA methyltransferase [Candidatus Onthovivens sp.]
MIKKISSVSNTFIKELYKLKNTKNIQEQKAFLVENEHLLEMSKQYLKCILTLNINENYDCDQYIVTKEIMEKLSSGKSPDRIIGLVDFPTIKPASSNKIIYLNKIQDPGNVGTIFRTALAFNYFDILCDNGCAFKYSSKVVAASQGAIFNLNIIDSCLTDLLYLKSQGYKIISTTLSPKSKKITDICRDFDKICIVFGNEGKGVDDEILKISDEFLKIEIDNIDSLNVAVSAGIILYSFKSDDLIH